MGNISKKNINIELLRCIACYFVIVNHTWSRTFRQEGNILHTELLVAGVIARCAVPIFLMITGYVYNNRSSIGHKYKKFVWHVLVPVILMSFFSEMILARGIHFFIDESQEYVSLVEYLKITLLSWGGRPSDLYLCGHFWYIEELIRFYLLLPILQFILCDEERANKIRRFLLTIGFFAYFIVPSIESLTDIKINNTYMPGGLIYIWYIVFGFELSVSKWKKVGKVGIVGHWLCVMIISLLEYNLDWLATGDIHHTFSSHSSIFNLGSAVCLFLFIINLNIPERYQKSICKVGQTTLGIYIVHVFVYSVLYHLKITVLLDYVPRVLFCFIYSTSVFAISFVGIKVMERVLAFVTKKCKWLEIKTTF